MLLEMKTFLIRNLLFKIIEVTFFKNLLQENIVCIL